MPECLILLFLFSCFGMIRDFVYLAALTFLAAACAATSAVAGI